MKFRLLIFAAVILLYLTSLGFPAFYLKQTDPMWGYSCLLYAPVAWIRIPEALANFLLIAWMIGVGLRLKKQVEGLIEPLVMTLFAVHPCLLAGMFLTRETVPVGPGNANITALGIGYYLWAAAMVLAFIGSFALLMATLLKSGVRKSRPSRRVDLAPQHQNEETKPV